MIYIVDNISNYFIYFFIIHFGFRLNPRKNLSELLLVETYGRKLRYLMLDGSEHFCEGRISETVHSLSQFGFFQIQRSYIINLIYIEKENSREVILCNGLEVTIGRTHSKEFKKEFFKWRMRFGN